MLGLVPSGCCEDPVSSKYPRLMSLADRDYARGRLRICLSGSFGRRVGRCAPIKVEEIKIRPNGIDPRWPLRDADLYVPSLIEGAFGSVPEAYAR